MTENVLTIYKVLEFVRFKDIICSTVVVHLSSRVERFERLNIQENTVMQQAERLDKLLSEFREMSDS